MDRSQQIERSIITKYRPKIFRPFMKALEKYDLISEGDKIAVCISGGKDSMLLAKCMQEIQKHGDIKFDLVFLVMNPGYTDYHLKQIIDNAEILNIPIEIFNSNIFDVVTSMDDSPCYVCARMRRGNLYAEAKKRGCNKIALGHHFNDVIETVLMSLLYGAEFKTMMPKLKSDNFEGMELIRPLYLVHEDDIISWAKYNNLTFIACACKFTLDNTVNEVKTSKRKEIKELIKKLKEVYPNIDNNIFQSTHNVNLNTIIGYHKGDFNYNFLDDYKIKNEKRN